MWCYCRYHACNHSVIQNIASSSREHKLIQTRTTRTPAFWDTPRCPMITHTSDSHQFPCQNKILQETLHVTHLLKLLDKMYKYEMDPTRTVGATERTQDGGRTDRGTDRGADRRTEWNQHTRQQLRCSGGIITTAPLPLSNDPCHQNRNTTPRDNSCMDSRK